jgi:putative peptidoglycan lipid II flippase
MSTPAIAPLAETAPPAASAAPAKSFVSHARLISVLTLVSRILGMAREGVMSTYFGAGTISSAFAVAFKVPNLFRKLLGEGALSAAFIPLYAQSLKSGGAAALQEANSFAAASVSLLVTILIALVGVGELGLWLGVKVIQPRPENRVIVAFTAIMLPYVLLICSTAFLSGILQVHRRFALPAMTPIVLNVIHIAVIVIGARLLMLRTSRGPGRLGVQTHLAYWLAAFVLVAGALQVAMLLPSLRAVGFRWRWVGRFWTDRVKRMCKLSVPVALGAGVLQLSVITDTLITVFLTRGNNPAERLHVFNHLLRYPMAPGAVARLNWAQFLYQFPLGVFAIALATAIFPTLSAHASEPERFRSAVRQGILVTLMEGLAASVGLILVRFPVIRLLYQHGAFTPSDTRWVALSTCFYAAAIWAFSLQQILNRAYYALHDTVTPLRLSIVTLIINTAVEVPLAFTRLGEAGMAVGTLVSFSIQAVAMLLILDRRVGGLGLGRIAGASAKMLAAVAVMAAVCLAARRVPGFPAGSGTLASLSQLAILVIAGGAAYLGTCRALGLRFSASP